MKYLGGKQRLGKHIAVYLKQKWDQLIQNGIMMDGYLEPFCGSLGVLKNMTDLNTNKIIANDYHPDLIQMWKEVRDGIFVFPEEVTEEQHTEAKKIPSPSALKSFIGFGLSFGGRYFGSFAHKYTNEKKEDFCKEMTHSLKRIAPVIKNVEFTNIDYLELQPINMFIYCDPPYRSTKYPIKYRKGVKKYDVFDNDGFWERMRQWSMDNFVVISEMSAPDDFIEVWNLERYRSACQSTKTRYNANSVVVSETYKKEKMFVYSKGKYSLLMIDDTKK
jgi:DNA adenine methylase